MKFGIWFKGVVGGYGWLKDKDGRVRVFDTRGAAENAFLTHKVMHQQWQQLLISGEVIPYDPDKQ